MNYEEFLNDVKTELSQRIDSSNTLEIRTFTKNNGTHRDGLIILKPGLNVSPTIYLMPYFHRYLDGVSMDDIYEDILMTYRANLPEEDFDQTVFTDYEKASKRIVMRLISYSRNEELLKDVPHFRYLDLAVVFYCMLHADERNQANILIHNEHLEMWHVTCTDLYEASLSNTPTLLPYELISMDTFLRSHCPELREQPEPDEKDIPIYILTNRFRTNGATAILYDGLLRQMADLFDRDLVLLPSSIHEFLLIPVDSLQGMDLSIYTDMVQEVNETELADEEVLSDHAYFFRRSDGLLSYEAS